MASKASTTTTSKPTAKAKADAAPKANPAEASPPAGPVELFRLGTHPLADLFSGLMAEIEKLPGGPRQTGLVVILGKLRESTQDYINGMPDRHTPASEGGNGGGDPATPTTGPAASVADGMIRIRVTGPQSGRRRAGRHFTPEPQVLDVTAEELGTLKSDSALEVITA